MNIIDRVVSFFSPESGIRRAQARATIKQLLSQTGWGNSPYSAAKINRLNGLRKTIVKENEVTTAALDSLRAEAWNLYRNNPTARKIIRSLESKVIGGGMMPEPLVNNADGTPNVLFRERAKQLWQRMQAGFDSRGLPGRGGLTMTSMEKLALRTAVLSGDSLCYLKPITQDEQIRRDLPVPMVLQMIDSARLADESDVLASRIGAGNILFRGIEFDSNFQPVNYWIRSGDDFQTNGTYARVEPVPARSMNHLYWQDDVDQVVGVSWFASVVLGMRDASDLQYNVLKATSMAACVVATYKKPTGVNRLGLAPSTEYNNYSADGTDTTDANGNRIDKLQPGLIVNVGKDGDFNLQSPNQPNMNPEAFVQHMQRNVATGIPGIKSSTVTGDYRNSSFSSERSADNDTWPEIHDLQAWFASSFCQPIYETVLRAAILDGFFDGIVTIEEFQSNPGIYSRCKWQGPVALSINPKDDAEAAQARIHAGLSSLQMECAKVNTNWRDVIDQTAELYQIAQQKGIPPEVVNNIIGVSTQDQLAAQQMTADTQPRSIREAYQRELEAAKNA